MNTLVTLNQQPLHTTNPSSWYSTTITNLPLSRTSWKLHAQAKGFGTASNNSTSLQKKQENAQKPGSSQEEPDDDDKIPGIVYNRMIRRILTSVGAPLAIGVVLLKTFDLLKENQLWDVPLWVPFVTTFVFFGSSVLGVPYGSLSTSWDAEKNGSLLGLEEAQHNWVQMWKEEEVNT